MPVRNGGLYIKECVASILRQTVKDFNLLVLINCSTDGTEEWLRSLNDVRVQLFPYNEPLGIYGNWARVSELPKNEFMTIIGYDDLVDENYLAVMQGLISRYPDASLYQAHFRYIDSKGKFKRHCLPMDEVQRGHDFLAFQMMRMIDSTATGYMMRSSDYERLGGVTDYPNLIFADFALWVRLTLLGYRATAAEECFSYRIHASTSALTNGEQYKRAFFQYLAFLQETAAHHTSVQEVIRRYGQSFLYYYCEGLSHRLLKTRRPDRNISVAGFIEECKAAADWFIPGQAFEPYRVFRIRIAAMLDRTAIGRVGFRLAKKLV